jgi:hypothetical protein
MERQDLKDPFHINNPFCWLWMAKLDEDGSNTELLKKANEELKRAIFSFKTNQTGMRKIVEKMMLLFRGGTLSSENEPLFKESFALFQSEILHNNKLHSIWETRMKEFPLFQCFNYYVSRGEINEYYNTFLEDAYMLSTANFFGIFFHNKYFSLVNTLNKQTDAKTREGMRKT